MNKVAQPAVDFGHMMSAVLSPWQLSRLSSGEDGEMKLKGVEKASRRIFQSKVLICSCLSFKNETVSPHEGQKRIFLYKMSV